MKQGTTSTLRVGCILAFIFFLVFCAFAFLPQPIRAQTGTATISVGRNPCGVAVTPNSAYAYVVNYGSGTVSVISTATNTVTATVPVGSSPEGVAITPNGDNVYVTNEGGNSVSVINTATTTVTATIPGFSEPIGMAVTPNGEYVYVTNSEINTVSVISTATNTVASTVTVGKDPYGVAVTPNGEYAYVTNAGSDTVSVINTATNAVAPTITGFNDPYGVAVTPNGNLVFVTNEGNGTVSVIVAYTNTKDETVSVGSEPYDVTYTPDGAYAYVTNVGSGTVSVISTTTATLTSTVTVGNDPESVAVTPNGAYAYVANYGSGTVSVINTLFVSVSPSSVTMYTGQSVTCTAAASGGSGTYTGYQWYVDGVAESGYTTLTFSFAPYPAGSYSVTATVTDSSGITSAQSNAAVVTALSTENPTPTPTLTPTSTSTPTATPTPTPASTPSPTSTAGAGTNTVTIFSSCAGTTTPAGSSFAGTATYTYNSGSTQTFTATESTGFNFLCWVIGAASGPTTSTTNPLSYTVNSDIALQPVFVPSGTPAATATPTSTPATEAVIVFASYGGSSNPTGVSTTAPYVIYTDNSGSTQTFTATPGTGFELLCWVIVGSTGGTASTNNPFVYTISQALAIQPVFIPTSSTVSLLTPTPTPTPNLPSPNLSFYCISSTSTSGFNVQILGALTYDGAGLSGAGIQLSDSVTGGATWQDLTYVSTDNNGSFTCVWNPFVSGNYAIEATWSGDSDYSNASAVYNFAVVPFDNQEQNVFSVTSNSTLTSLTFDSATNELSFGVSGPSGTTGLTEVCIPQSLVSDISKINVMLDGSTINCTSVSEGNVWLITFTYHHSSHTIVIALDSSTSTVPEFPTWIILPLFTVIVLVSTVFIRKRIPKTASFSEKLLQP